MPLLVAEYTIEYTEARKKIPTFPYMPEGYVRPIAREEVKILAFSELPLWLASVAESIEVRLTEDRSLSKTLEEITKKMSHVKT